KTKKDLESVFNFLHYNAQNKSFISLFAKILNITLMLRGFIFTFYHISGGFELQSNRILNRRKYAFWDSTVQFACFPDCSRAFRAVPISKVDFLCNLPWIGGLYAALAHRIFINLAAKF
uniref:Uncharacterized protein n=1 Tax=Glossina pallidipes TaxID=7398 RepID=A0A1A9ZJT6_GLOPL